LLPKLARYIGRHHLGLLALFVALGGTSYATVVNVPRGSVGTLELKRNAVKAAKIAPNAVRTGHVLNASLLAEDFKPGQIPKGEKGDRGEKGDKGDPGATNVVVRAEEVSIQPQGGALRTVMCEAGERAVGGGGGFTASSPLDYLGTSYPVEADQTAAEAGDTPAGWRSRVGNNDLVAKTAVFSVVCARP
jgi:hypothetical protein